MLPTSLATLLLWLSIAPQAAQATQTPQSARPIPPAPELYVLDEPGLLASQQRKALETILIEHDRIAGEQIVVAIFAGLDGEDAAQRTRQVFEEWEIGKRGRDNGALLAIYAKEHRGALAAGYGLQAVDESVTQAIVRDTLPPELDAGQTYRAAGLGVLELLKAIESPLIESGRAEQLLQQGGLTGNLRPVHRALGRGGWLALALAGVLIFGTALHHVLAAEAHFTGDGWFKPKVYAPAWLSPRARQSANAGGIDGSW